MPIEPSTLRRYAPPEATAPERSDGLRALIIAGGGLAAIGAFFGLAWFISELASAFVAAALFAGVALVGALVVIGLREDGIVGALYRLRHPLGTKLAGDDRPSWTAWAIVLLYITASVLAVVLVLRHPGALPSWVHRSEARQSDR